MRNQLLTLFIILFVLGCSSQNSIKTESNTDDGSNFVTSILKEKDGNYTHTKTKDIPNNPKFKSVEEGKQIWGDIAWWSNFMGIYDAFSKSVITSKGSIKLSDLIKRNGKVRWYRYGK